MCRSGFYDSDAGIRGSHDAPKVVVAVEQRQGGVDTSPFHFHIHSDPSLRVVNEISFVSFVDPVD